MRFSLRNETPFGKGPGLPEPARLLKGPRSAFPRVMQPWAVPLALTRGLGQTVTVFSTDWEGTAPHPCRQEWQYASLLPSPTSEGHRRLDGALLCCRVGALTKGPPSALGYVLLGSTWDRGGAPGGLTPRGRPREADRGYAVRG